MRGAGPSRGGPAAGRGARGGRTGGRGRGPAVATEKVAISLDLDKKVMHRRLGVHTRRERKANIHVCMLKSFDL